MNIRQVRADDFDEILKIKLAFESICELETRDGLLVALLRKETLPSVAQMETAK